MQAFIFFLLFIMICGGVGVTLAIKFAPGLQSWYQRAKLGVPLRLGMLLALLIALSIPLLIVDNLVRERMTRYRSVLHSIGQEWGAPQRVTGPFLIVPYQYQVTHREQVKDSSGEVREVKRVETVQTRAIFLPDELKMNAKLNPEYRKRSIYQSLVYTADLSVKGVFPALRFDRFPHPPQQIHWDKSHLSFGLSDTRAIKRQTELKWGDQTYDFASGPELSLIASGIHAPLQLGDAQGQAPVSFSIQLSFNGSLHFEWSPLGRESEVTVTSPWPNPSFQGLFLPETREISESGFSATWRVPSLARSYPQSWEDGARNLNGPMQKYYGAVHLFEPVHIYTNISRAVKYGFLFIGLSLLALVLIERASQLLLRAVHYGLSVSTLILFYLLILSMSEHWGFSVSYLAASAIVTVTVGVYHWSAFQRAKLAGAVFGVMASLYLTLFFILQLEDFALLMGTSLLLVVLWVVMYQTRGIRAAQLTEMKQEADEVKAEAS